MSRPFGMSQPREADPSGSLGWSTRTEFVREFDGSTPASDAVALTVFAAIEEWPELSEARPLAEFIDAENLDELFSARARENVDWIPSVTFQFQGCRVTVLYGSKLRVLIERNP